MFRRASIAAVMVGFLATPAFAGCMEEVEKVDEALRKNTELAEAQRTKAQEFRDQGAQQCEDGNVEEARASLDKAKEILVLE